MTASRNPLVRLHHIEDEVRNLTNAIKGVTHSAFVESYVLRRTAERALLIVSEAAKALPVELTRRYPEIDWPALKALGNVLRHDYQTIDPDTLWEIVTRKVPELAPVIARMIEETRS